MIGPDRPDEPGSLRDFGNDSVHTRSEEVSGDEATGRRHNFGAGGCGIRPTTVSPTTTVVVQRCQRQHILLNAVDNVGRDGKVVRQIAGTAALVPRWNVKASVVSEE
jgi:hypothetical protein